MERSAAPRSEQREGACLPLLRRLLPILLLTLVAAAFVVTMADGGQAFASFRRIQPLSVAVALLLAIIPWFTDAARSAIWCRFLGRPVPYVRLIRIAAAAEVGAAVAPPFVGTVPVKTMLLSREGCTSGEALSLTTLASLEDWVFYLIALPCCLTVAGPAGLPGPQVTVPDVIRVAAWAAGCGAVIFLIAFALLRRGQDLQDGSAGREWLNRPVRWFIGTWHDLAGVYRLVARRGASQFLLTLLLTAVQWGCRYSVTAVLVGGMGLPTKPGLFFALQILICGLATIVPTPGGAGGAEALFALLHRPYFPGASLGVVTAAWRITSFYLPVLLASMIAFVPLPAARGDNGRSNSEAAQAPSA
jgi:uncharacterized protein (TIRG00374 family)